MDSNEGRLQQLAEENRRLAAELERARALVGPLDQELEQARVLIEAGEAQLTAMNAECKRLDNEVRSRAERQRASEALISELRAHLDGVSAASESAATKEMREMALREELRVSVEELQVTAEELEETNEALRVTNADLEQRVAERTAALAETNAELSRRVEMEVAARQEAQRRLFEQQKLEALGQLTGGVAHDFNNLLAIVVSGLHMLRRTDDPERREHLLRHVEAAADRGVNLTRRLLSFGRRQALRPEPIDLVAQSESLRELLSHALRGDLRIEARVAPEVWPVEVDRGELELSLINLTVNARDAMPGGGTVTIAARNLPLGAAAAERFGVQPGDYVEISVTDTGTGMSPEVMAHIFEPFFTTKDFGKGTGLGLPQVLGFAQQSGGGMRVESRLGNGTKVALALPRSANLPAAMPDPLSAGQAGRMRDSAGDREPEPVRASILVVEDDDEVAALVTDLLEQLGHTTTRVASAAAAVKALSQGREHDLLFTDVLLPGGASGLDLAREVARCRPDLPVVLTTGYGGPVTAEMETARLPLLRKPYRADALRSVINEALAARCAGGKSASRSQPAA